MLEILPYTDEYKNGVLSVLKRNFPFPPNKSSEWLYNWLEPLFTYNWIAENVNVSDVPFKYGAVLAKGKDVVGFFGTMYSYRHIEGRKLLWLVPALWCIDPEYRAHIFKVTSELYKTADIVLDLTPIETYQEIDTKLFGFYYFNDKVFVFKPVPILKRHKVNIKFFHEASEISDTEDQIIFRDHERYNCDIRYVSFECNGETGSAFYVRRYFRRFKLIWKKLRIVSVSNRKLFTSHLHEILWKIQKHEKFLALVEVDAHFTEGNFHHPLFTTKHVDRLMFSKEKLNIKPDFLYSELSMFN